MRWTQRVAMPILSTALWWGASALAQSLPKGDVEFLQQAAHNGMAEVEASKVAESKARLPEVKTFAAQMVADHTQADAELKQLAAAKKVELPKGPSVMQKTQIKLISAGDDKKFDERYVEAFGVKAHEETVRLFESAAKGAQDGDVKAFAQKTLPALQHHLEMARALKATTAAAR